jgi:hypothetical protein
MLCHCFRKKPSWARHCQMEQRDVALLRASTESYWREIRVSWMPHGSPMKSISTWMVTLTSKLSDVGPQRNQNLPSSTHCIQRVKTWCAVLSVGILGPVFIHGTVNSDLFSVRWVMELFLSWWDMAVHEFSLVSLRCTRPHTGNVILRFLHDGFVERDLLNHHP